jgi:hypothetical protein
MDRSTAKTAALVVGVGLSVLGIAGCKNCGVYEASSAGGVTVGEHWNKSLGQVQSYFCKTPGWQGESSQAGAASYGPECQKAREFSADFERSGHTYVARVRDGVVVSVGRRSVCIDP